MSKLTTEEFICKSIQVNGDKYHYSKSEYVNCIGFGVIPFLFLSFLYKQYSVSNFGNKIISSKFTYFQKKEFSQTLYVRCGQKTFYFKNSCPDLIFTIYTNNIMLASIIT